MRWVSEWVSEYVSEWVSEWVSESTGQPDNVFYSESARESASGPVSVSVSQCIQGE